MRRIRKNASKDIVDDWLTFWNIVRITTIITRNICFNELTYSPAAPPV